ncbi:ABC transporter permease [Aestuariibacter halophilus]|uniref:ABC transporter permease n=1 Tax=Fluctibacter halophilus TaxID=226011 RepID=A0ABS8GAB0_9ALTE|nr:ABC transporter permease [Aestuariibacter halophilus]MCC2617031.1 ABC transporter permease [Aestuariibacter halophilus]
MLSNYLLTAWRNIHKNALFSAINIIGLAVGLMSCILILLFVRSETGYDQWIPNSDKVARLHTAYTPPGRPPFLTVRSAGMMMPAVRDYLRNDIEAGVRLVQFGTTVQRDGEGFAESATFVDGSFFDVLDLPFAHGSAQSSFTDEMNFLVTERIANKYFGRTDVVGETLTLCCVQDRAMDVAITGVLKDLPDNTHLNIDLLIYLPTQVFANIPGVLDTWTSVNVYTYFKLRENATLAGTQERLTHWINTESPFVEMAKNTFGGLPEGTQVSDMVQHKLMALEDLHLRAHEDAGNMGDLSPMGDQAMVVTFTLIAGLVLFIACINFMNLATARASQRAREVAMRKVLGATRGQVAIQFLAEAIALVMLSLLVALIAVELVLPVYNDILGKQLTFEVFNDPTLLLILVGGGLLVGVLAGSYPALVLSRYMPAQILKASKSNDSGASTRLRSALVVCQFSISIGLLICTAVIFAQTRHANSIDVGYQSDDKLVLNIRAAGDNLDSLRQQLLNLPEITSVVYSSEAPTQDNENNQNFTLLSSSDQGEQVTELLNYHNMGLGFFEAYDVQPLAGRLFDEAHGTDRMQRAEEGETRQASAIVNESAARKLGFASPQQAIGQVLQGHVSGPGMQQLTIIGVIPDIYFRSIKFDIRPSVYMMNPDRFRVASLQFDTNDLPALMAKVEDVWSQHVPMQPISLSVLSEMMVAQYHNEDVQMRLFTAFAVLAVLVACLGLYGLAAFSAERRTKEIGIRKVMGARVRDIVMLLLWQFSRPVLLANAIAWPLACWWTVEWLQSFPYRLETWWLLPICAVVGGGSLMIAWLTIGGNAARVARANPVNALRFE